MIKISSIVITLLTTACIVWDATCRAHTGASQIPHPGESLDAHGAASLGTTHGVGNVKTGENVGGDTVSTKTVGVGQGTNSRASAGTADAVVQDTGGGKVLVKTVGVGKGAGGGANFGTAGSVGQSASVGKADGVVQDIGGGKDLGKTFSVGNGGATVGTAGGVGQIASDGRVLGKTFRVGKDEGNGASVGTADGGRQRVGGVATLGTTGSMRQSSGGVVQDIDGGRVRVKTITVGQGQSDGAGVGTAVGRVGGGASVDRAGGVGQAPGGGWVHAKTTGVEQGAGNGRVRVKTVSAGQGVGDGATIGTTGDVVLGVSGVASASTAGGVDQGAGCGASICTADGVSSNAGGGRVHVKPVAVDHGAAGGASTATVGGVSPGAGGDRVRVKTVDVGRDLGILFAVGHPGGRKRKKNPVVVSPPCTSNGFSTSKIVYWCVCNFVGACDKNDVPVDEAQADFYSLKGFAPKGIEAFKYGQTVTICEKNTVAILFDCDGHIPLYAGTVINGSNTAGSLKRTSDSWKGTSDNILKRVQALYVAGNKDYEGSSCMVYCYEDSTSKTFKAWNGSPCSNSGTFPELTFIDRGHMVAAAYGYGHGKDQGAEGTFTYTNVVPQIGSFNRGAWAQGEIKVMEFAKKCQYNATLRSPSTYGKVYVVVGVIPTSFLGEPKFFGEANFSNFQNAKYRILLPLVMWTAGCCVHNDGFFDGKLAFYGWNLKIDQEVRPYDSASEMFRDMNTTTWPNQIPDIVVFPNMTECN